MIDIVVIGAGITGIACARALNSAGIAVRLIDKGRGIGGRVATRRVDVAGERITFDHGAQSLDHSDDAAIIAGLARDATDTWRLEDGRSRIVGVPGMAALPKALAKGLNITLNTRVTALTARGGLWEIETDAGKTTATHVIVTVPAPQLAPILGETHAVVQQAERVEMDPCMTVMAAFDHDRTGPFVSRRDENDVLAWIAQDNSKPGRSTALQTWVAQARSDWSIEHIDADRAEIKTQMVKMLCEELSFCPSALRHAGLQGWRYGIVKTPLGQPFVSHAKLWAGGDWCCGPKVQDAWHSGTQIAMDLKSIL